MLLSLGLGALYSFVTSTAVGSAVVSTATAAGGAIALGGGAATLAGGAAVLSGISGATAGIGASALTLSGSVGTAVTAIRAASTAEKVFDAASLLSMGYSLAKYVHGNDADYADYDDYDDDYDEEEEIKAAIVQLREDFPEATDEELRELILRFMHLQRKAVA